MFICGFCHLKNEKGSDLELLRHLDRCKNYLLKYNFGVNRKKYNKVIGRKNRKRRKI